MRIVDVRPRLASKIAQQRRTAIRRVPLCKCFGECGASPYNEMLHGSLLYRDPTAGDARRKHPLGFRVNDVAVDLLDRFSGCAGPQPPRPRGVSPSGPSPGPAPPELRRRVPIIVSSTLTALPSRVTLPRNERYR